MLILPTYLPTYERRTIESTSARGIGTAVFAAYTTLSRRHGTKDQLPMERALGVHWCVHSHSLKFKIELKDVPCTRRGILSTISSIYDPLGLIAPVVLVGKQILQDLCHGSSWDEPVPDDVYTKWERWRSELRLLHQLNVQRSFKPAN